MTKHISRFGLRCATLITAASLFLSVTTVRAAEDNSALVSKLLSQAKTQAYQLREDAAEMELLTQVHESASSATQISLETKAEAINSINGDVNAMMLLQTKLDNARKMAAPWQQMAIDEIKPLVMELASNTQVVIQYINNAPTKLNSADYKDYVEANSDQAAQLAALINSFIDYGKAKERLQRIGDKVAHPDR